MIIAVIPTNVFAISNTERMTTDLPSDTRQSAKVDSDFSSYSTANIKGFKDYLVSVNIDINTLDGITYVDTNASALYNDAIDKGYGSFLLHKNNCFV